MRHAWPPSASLDTSDQPVATRCSSCPVRPRPRRRQPRRQDAVPQIPVAPGPYPRPVRRQARPAAAARRIDLGPRRLPEHRPDAARQARRVALRQLEPHPAPWPWRGVRSPDRSRPARRRRSACATVTTSESGLGARAEIDHIVRSCTRSTDEPRLSRMPGLVRRPTRDRRPGAADCGNRGIRPPNLDDILKRIRHSRRQAAGRRPQRVMPLPGIGNCSEWRS